MTASEENRLKFEVDFNVAPAVLDCFNTLERTEDLGLSPDGRWLAVANYALDGITLFSIDTAFTNGAEPPRLTLNNFWQLKSSTLSEPHGLDFLDNTTLVVANRTGSIDIFDLPSRPPLGQAFNTQPVKSITRARKGEWLTNPGSVCALKLGGGRIQILSLSNYQNYITSHTISHFGPFRRTHNQIILSEGIDIPDGIAVSDDRKFIAVSNHVTHEVFIYAYQGPKATLDPPCAVLKNVVYPHGLRFCDGHSKLIVTSAGSPHVHLYDCVNAPWAGNFKPVNTFKVLDDETFKAGADNTQEGGPKGLEITRDEKLLLVTNELMPLRAFDLQAMLAA